VLWVSLACLLRLTALQLVHARYSYRSLDLHKHGAKRHLPISPFRSPWRLNKCLFTVCPCDGAVKHQIGSCTAAKLLRSAWLAILGAVARCPKAASWASGRPAFARMLVCQTGTSVLLFAESTMFPSHPVLPWSNLSLTGTLTSAASCRYHA